MDIEQEEELLVDERESEMVSPTSCRNPTKRKGRFLLPTTNSPHECPSLQCNPITIGTHKPPEVLFVYKGWWTKPQPKWQVWVSKLLPIYKDLWIKAGIYEAIQASTYVVRKDHCSILGVVEFWCRDTNTFHFRSSEATITLEDVMILGGFPVLGGPIRGEEMVTEEMEELELKMAMEHRTVMKACKKVVHSAWMKHFIEGEGEETEHIAFLSLWLSRFVFPSHPFNTVRPGLFLIAIRIARGARIALAPPVLASLYRDLGAMRNHLVDIGSSNVSPLVVWAPFQILQLWLWERFISLRPKDLNFVNYEEPRVARWHDVGKTSEPSFVHSVFKSRKQFLWRPYAISLNNWRIPGFYMHHGGWFSAADNETLSSFSRCLRACELVGLNCIEQYLPQRVAMQFGLDQDLPCSVPRANSTWEVAWETYDISNSRFYVPPRLFESDVTLRYSIWWKRYMKKVKRSRRKMIEGKKGKGLLSQAKKKKRRLKDVHESTLSDWLALRDCSRKFEIKLSDSSKPNRKLKLSLSSAEKVGKSPDVGHAFTSDPMDIEDREIEHDINMVDVEESSSDSKTVVEAEGTLVHQVKFKMEKTDKNMALLDKKQKPHIQLKLGSISSLEKVGEDSGNSRQTIKEEGNVVDQASSSDPLDSEEDKVIDQEIEIINVRDSSRDSIIGIKAEGTIANQVNFEMEKTDKNTPLVDEKQIPHTKLKLRLISSLEKVGEDSGNLRQTTEEEVNGVDQDSASDPLGTEEDKGIDLEIEIMNVGDSSRDFIIVMEAEGTIANQVNSKMEKTDKNALVDGGSELDKQIEKLKEEIAVIQAKIKEQESQAEVHSNPQPFSCLL